MQSFQVSTQGHSDIINITDKVNQAVKRAEIEEGIALVFALHSTVAVAIIEDEEGVKRDIREVWEELIPEERDYHHHRRWGDHNGAAHIRSSINKPSLVVPVSAGRAVLGQWQELVLIDFDERPRERKIIVQIISS